jgi:hypothetical protein
MRQYGASLLEEARNSQLLRSIRKGGDFGTVFYVDGRVENVSNPSEPEWSEDGRFWKLRHQGGVITLRHEDFKGYTVHYAQSPTRAKITGGW